MLPYRGFVARISSFHSSSAVARYGDAATETVENGCQGERGILQGLVCVCVFMVIFRVASFGTRRSLNGCTILLYKCKMCQEKNDFDKGPNTSHDGH